MGTFDPDKYQDLLNARDELDDVLVGLTRYQAQKCAAIITAGQAGHSVYVDATGLVTRYLQALALDALPGTARIHSDSAALWQVLDDLPWPAPGPPARQPT